MKGILVLLAALCATTCQASTLRLDFHAPIHNADNGNRCGLPDSTMVFGSLLDDLSEIRVKGFGFVDTDTFLVGTIPAMASEGDLYEMDLDVAGVGVFFLTSVDTRGNESCPGSQFLFAFPGDLSIRNMVWSKP